MAFHRWQLGLFVLNATAVSQNLHNIRSQSTEHSRGMIDARQAFPDPLNDERTNLTDFHPGSSRQVTRWEFKR